MSTLNRRHPVARGRLARCALAACASIALAACGASVGPGDGGDPITELPRDLTVAERAVISSSNAFGMDLMAEVLERDDRLNVVLSPLSASMALGMAMNGASGATFEGMRTALRFQALSRDEINDSYRGLLDLLRELDPAVELAVANSAWANESYTFHPPFFDRVTEHFDAEVRSLSFADPATLAAINGWANDRTEGRIQKIIDELSPDLALLLMNAVYFDGTWTTRFDRDRTQNRPFTRDDGSVVTVPMMSMKVDEKFPFGGTEELTAVELPYGGGAFSMVVAMPPGHGQGTAREILAGMDAADWDALTSSLQVRELDGLALPRFTTAYDALLNGALAELGMEDAFTRRADFSDLSPTPLCIDYVRQKTFIEVDEAGTRAAAVTAVGMGPTSFIGLIADRPFIFAIRERLSGTILFVGVIGDPTLEDSGPGEDAGPCAQRG